MKISISIILVLMMFLCKAEIPEKALSLEDVIFLANNSINYQILQQKKLYLEKSKDEKFYYYFPKLMMTSTLPEIINYHVLTDSSYITKGITAGVNITQNLFYNSVLTAGLYGSEVLEEPETSYKYLSLALSTEIHYKMKFNKEYSSIKRSLEIEQLELESAIIDYQYMVVQKYYDLYRVISEHEIESRGYNLSLKHYNEGVSKYKAGIIPEVEMLDLELYLQKKELSLNRSKNTLSYFKEEFTRFIKYPNDYDIRLKYDNKEVLKHNVDLLKDLDGMFRSNPEFLRYRNEILNNEDALGEVYRTKSIKGQLSMSYFMDGSNNAYDLNYDNDNSKTVFSLGLSIPLFDGGDLGNSIDIAKLNLKISKEKLKDVQIELENLFRSKVRNLELNYENLEITKKGFNLSEKIYNISQNRFENGLITSKDFIQNQIDYISNKQDMINSEIDYILSVYEYKKFIGIRLF
ncbi:MAG: TolC family protein [Candidatus Delongbacteria bacterium]|jgi:outer membrane protein|nr:TolC family protein [Candidatus Delongbacteria bacterium]